jgi:hypothetical protein
VTFVNFLDTSTTLFAFWGLVLGLFLAICIFKRLGFYICLGFGTFSLKFDLYSTIVKCLHILELKLICTYCQIIPILAL